LRISARLGRSTLTKESWRVFLLGTVVSTNEFVWWPERASWFVNSFLRADKERLLVKSSVEVTKSDYFLDFAFSSSSFFFIFRLSLLACYCSICNF
jgi:hypothetical protein